MMDELKREIEVMTDVLEGYLKREAELRSEFSQIQEQYEVMKARVLLGAYDDGTINGKNADIRRLQETKVVAEHEELASLAQELAEARLELAQLEAKRKATEEYIRTLRAWLYAQSGVAKVA